MKLTKFDYAFPNYSNNNNRSVRKYYSFSRLIEHKYCFSTIETIHHKWTHSCIYRLVNGASMIRDWE
jgi:hypothetical protein